MKKNVKKRRNVQAGIKNVKTFLHLWFSTDKQLRPVTACRYTTTTTAKDTITREAIGSKLQGDTEKRKYTATVVMRCVVNSPYILSCVELFPVHRLVMTSFLCALEKNRLMASAS